MINSIIDAISIALNSAFGEGYEIYTESVEQGLKEPCFSIFCLNPTNRLFRGERYFRQNMFCIQYFPSTDEKGAECNDVSESLFDCLEYISVEGNLTRGTKMHGELVDWVLNFFINYDMFVYKVKETTPMGELQKTNTGVKG